MAASRSYIAVVAGVTTGAVWLGLMETTVRFIPEASPWESTISSIVTSLAPIFPGFVAGFVATRGGFTVGAAAAVLTSILWGIYANFVNPRSVMEPPPFAIIPAEVTYALVAVVVGGICGIAGAAIGRDRWNA